MSNTKTNKQKLLQMQTPLSESKSGAVQSENLLHQQLVMAYLEDTDFFSLLTSKQRSSTVQEMFAKSVYPSKQKILLFCKEYPELPQNPEMISPTLG